MIKTQDPKYGISDDGKICNIATGKPIPDDEPIFILRAKDHSSVSLLETYADRQLNKKHIAAVTSRISDFMSYAANNPKKMKDADSVFPYPSIEKERI